MVVLKLGDKRPAVRFFQEGYEERRQNGWDWPPITVDGEFGPETMAAAQRACRALGAMEITLRYARMRKCITVGMQRMVRWPEDRNARQLQRARDRRPDDTLRERAYQKAVAFIGVMEKGGNNVGAEVEEIIRIGGGRRGDAWCGWFIAACYKLAGSKSVVWQWGAVRLLYPLIGIKRTKYPDRGDLVRFTFDHVGMFVAHHGGQIETIEGNTGRTGAVSDSETGGDGVYRKRRSKGLVRDYLRVTR